MRECDEEATLGFDTETRPAFRKGEVHPPATLQLSTATATLVVPLLHLDAPPALLLDTLASTHIAKVGVGIDDDAIELWLHHGARRRHSKRRPRLRLSPLEARSLASALAGAPLLHAAAALMLCGSSSVVSQLEVNARLELTRLGGDGQVTSLRALAAKLLNVQLNKSNRLTVPWQARNALLPCRCCRC